MSVVMHVRSNKGIVRQLAVRQVCREVREGNDIQPLDTAVYNIGKVREWSVVADVRISIAADISDGRDRLGIALPCLSGGKQVTHNVVGGDGGGISVVIGDDLASGQFQIIPDGRVRVGIRLCQQYILRRKAVEVGHCAAADYA